MKVAVTGSSELIGNSATGLFPGFPKHAHRRGINPTVYLILMSEPANCEISRLDFV